MAGRAISLEFDLGQVNHVLGYVQGMTETIKTARFIGPVLKFAHSEMAQEFDRELDLIAATNPSAFYHVYAWRMVGHPQGRLWKHTVGKTINNSFSHEASWEWRADRTPILTPEERSMDPLGISDPIQDVDPSLLSRLNPKSYYFFWKAPVMEYGLTTNVYAKNAKMLFVPSRRSASHGGFYRAKHTVQDFHFANPQDHSGGQGTVGRFTAYWTSWWSGVGKDAVWKGKVQRIIERDIGISEKEMAAGAHARRLRNKPIGITTFSDERAAFEAGKRSAEIYYLNRASGYSRAANHTEGAGAFDD